MVPEAIERNSESRVDLADVDRLINLRIPLRTLTSDRDMMVVETEEGVREESRVRR